MNLHAGPSGSTEMPPAGGANRLRLVALVVTYNRKAQLHRTIKSVFPQALVAPYVTVAATDARVYVGLCPEATYRFMPLLMAQSDIERLHGTNERLRPDAYQLVVRFYGALIKNVQPPR